MSPLEAKLGARAQEQLQSDLLGLNLHPRGLNGKPLLLEKAGEGKELQGNPKVLRCWSEHNEPF